MNINGLILHGISDIDKRLELVLKGVPVEHWGPIIVQGKTVNDGQQRVLIARRLGYTDIPGIQVGRYEAPKSHSRRRNQIPESEKENQSSPEKEKENA